MRQGAYGCRYIRKVQGHASCSAARVVFCGPAVLPMAALQALDASLVNAYSRVLLLTQVSASSALASSYSGLRVRIECSVPPAGPWTRVLKSGSSQYVSKRWKASRMSSHTRRPVSASGSPRACHIRSFHERFASRQYLRTCTSGGTHRSSRGSGMLSRV